MPRYRRALRKRGPLPFRYVLLLSFAFFTISTVISLWMINSSIKPMLMNIGEMETKRVATEVITESIEEYMSHSDNVKDMVDMKTDENGKVTTMDFN
ncbi:sporulation protein YunB, partial [Bacillus velezensis]